MGADSADSTRGAFEGKPNVQHIKTWSQNGVKTTLRETGREASLLALIGAYKDFFDVSKRIRTGPG